MENTVSDSCSGGRQAAGSPTKLFPHSLEPFPLFPGARKEALTREHSQSSEVGQHSCSCCSLPSLENTTVHSSGLCNFPPDHLT